MNDSRDDEKPSASFTSDTDDFSLVLGGPLFQLLNRARLSGTALELVRKRILFFVLLTWLPLLLLAAIEGQLLGGGVAIPFLMDVDVHVRFLVAMPLLIGAELIVHKQGVDFVGSGILDLPDDREGLFLSEAIALCCAEVNQLPAISGSLLADIDVFLQAFDFPKHTTVQGIETGGKFADLGDGQEGGISEFDFHAHCSGWYGSTGRVNEHSPRPLGRSTPMSTG